MGLSKLTGTSQSAVGPVLASLLPQDAKPWYRTRHLVQLNLVLMVPWLSAAAYGYDGSIMNGLQSLHQWRNYFDHPTASILGTINAIYPVGKFFGLFATAWISDRYGRKVPLYIGFFLLVVGAIMQTCSHEVALFIVARLVLGVGTAFVSQPSPILISELAYPTHRGRLTAMYYSTYHMVLESSLSPSRSSAPDPNLSRVLCTGVTKARRTFCHYHAGGDESSPIVDFEIAEIERSIALERSINSEMSYVDLVKTPANRKRTVIAVIVGFYGTWAGISVIAYYLTLVLNTIGITKTSDQTLINGCTQIFNLIVSLFAGLLVDRIGRRKLWLGGVTGMLLSYIGWTVLSARFQATQNVEMGRSVLAFIFLYKLFYNGTYSPMLLAYPIEIFPYTLRSRGLSTSMSVNQIALIMSQFVTPIALENIGWRYYIVFCALLAVLLVLVYFLFPETKGKTLEEIADVFDGTHIADVSGEKAGVYPESVWVEEVHEEGKDAVGQAQSKT